MKKIMFNDRYGLTTAVLEGRKTMTRRIIPIDETQGGAVPISFWNGKWVGAHGRPLKSQPYKIGEEVAIAQKYSECVNDILINWGHKTDIATLAFKRLAGWDNKMFVQAELMPHRIRITDIRVERLQAISDGDCLREGIEWCHGSQSYYVNYIPETGFRYWLRGKTAREAFAALIDKVSGKGTWKNNPFVWVYSFELIK